jgi:hypothetical protein
VLLLLDLFGGIFNRLTATLKILANAPERVAAKNTHTKQNSHQYRRSHSNKFVHG